MKERGRSEKIFHLLLSKDERGGRAGSQGEQKGGTVGIFVSRPLLQEKTEEGGVPT